MSVKPGVIAWIGCALLFAPPHFTRAEPGGPSFIRREDPVILRGADLAPIAGRATAVIRLLARHGDAVRAVPFQIDRREHGGGYLHHFVRDREDRPWRDNPALAAHPALGPDDELVFLSRDAGTRWSPPDGGEGGAVVEITLRDPVDGALAYAYLAAPGAEAPRATGDYVRYDPARRIVESEDLSYGRCDPLHPAVFNYLAVGDSGNLLNRFRTQLSVTALFGQIGMDRDEEDVETRLLAYSDGPVRVLLRQESRIAGLFWMQSEWVERLFVNYPTRVEIPTHVRVPFRPGLLISEARADVVLELTAAAARAAVTHPALPSPMSLEPGRPESSSDLAPGAIQGFALSGPFGGLTARFREDPRFEHMGLSRRFLCRPAASNGAAAAISLPAVGMRIGGIERIQRGTYDFLLILGGRRGFRPGDEQEFDRIDTRPLAVSAAPLPDPPRVVLQP